MNRVLSFNPVQPWLAPLAGYSDLPFRLLCREYGAYVACTEMVSIKGLYYEKKQGGKATTGSLLATCPEDLPLIIQLFGTDIPIMRSVLESLCLEFGGNIYFDLNMGCSVPKVVKTGAGAAMLKDIDSSMEVAKAMLEVAGAGRVGFKIRLGWQEGQAVYLDLAKRLEQAGAGWLAVHPRYAKQGFSGQADWSCLVELKEQVNLPIIASGDLLTVDKAMACIAQTGADSVMFARGALSNPAIFMLFKNKLLFKMASAGLTVQPEEQLPDSPVDLSLDQLLAVIRRHVYLSRKYSSNKSALFKMRTFIPRYVKHLPGIKFLRQRLSVCDSWDLLEEILFKYKQEQK